ncbi:MAG TPA: riboflavin synthase [Vicinamibacterales bacterium]|nr:riboflavin synthase [Vicinamibacterales bacterium]
MFTGLIEAVGIVSDLTGTSSGFRLAIQTPLGAELREGESVAVNGVCLTATTRTDAGWSADIGPETARVTTLGTLVPGQPVNLERSMRADGRFGGHFVQGHVDGMGVVESIRQDGESYWLGIRIPRDLEPFLILKGSIAIDGVSLTVARLERGLMHVMIIPFTWAHTTLSSLRSGDRVNLECDMVGKYVARSMELAARPGLTS